MENNGLDQTPSPTLRVLALLRRKLPTTAFLLGLILVTSSLDIAIPFFTQRLIDGIVRAVSGVRAFALPMLFSSLAAIFVSVATARALRSFYNYRLFKTIAGIEDEIKSAAFENFLNWDMSTLNRSNSGQIIGNLDRGGTAIFVILYEILGQNLVPPLIVFLGVFASLLLKSWMIALTVFLPLPIYLLIVGRFSAGMHEREQEVSRGFETVSKECYDIAGNSATVKKFSQEHREASLQRFLLGRARIPQFRAERNWATIENLQTLIATLGRVTVIGLGGYFVLQHRCSVGEYVLFIALQDMLFGPMGQLSILLPKLRRNLARAEALFEIYDRQPALKDSASPALIPEGDAAIELRHVSFRYPGSDAYTLDDVNFRVPAGATVALIGRSGTGKSTLINLLLRCYDPQRGGIFLNGVNIRDAAQSDLRGRIATVPQEVDLFSRTVAENIAYGSPQATRAEIEAAARMALAHDFIEGMELGYDTVVGERGLRLSGGERQRIGIARALLRNPSILVLDEATSHLDTESEHLIQQAIERAARGRTCFIIAHRLSTVRHADLVVVFANGGIEAVGTHQELWHRSPTYRRLHELHGDRDHDVITDQSYDSQEEMLQLAS
ncbi:MAG TPA: ABC transporter ATP-binding protein [Bryobacteraceae bacterium]|jgi:ABC-type multidrug transport system fused ATPase/permease subunit|nr:ABC transporter ATP-binding protein [Bryobacteraceae bacterium]